MNTALLLAVYAVIPIFCAYMVYKTGKETSDRLDRIYERYNKMDDKIIDFFGGKKQNGQKMTARNLTKPSKYDTLLTSPTTMEFK